MGKYTKAVLLTLILTVMTVVFCGCNTMEGLGQDIQATGRALEDAAD